MSFERSLMTFDDELLGLLDKYKMQFDERYLWD